MKGVETSAACRGIAPRIHARLTFQKSTLI